jgi:cell division protein FtsW
MYDDKITNDRVQAAPSSFHRGGLRRLGKDALLDEPLHTEEPRKKLPLVQGSVDMTFLLIVVALVLYGIIMAYSASSIYGVQHKGDSLYYIKRHLMFVAIAVAVTVPFVLQSRPWFWRLFGICTYGASIFLLLLVLVFGASEGEAQRWIAIGPITIQPSEIAKLGVVMMLALLMTKYQKKVMSNHRFGGNFRYGVLLPGACMGVVVLLVAAEKHISGVMIIAMIGAVVMFMGGTKMKWLLLLAGIVALGGIALVAFSSYADTRIQLWLHIDQMDPLGEAWQTLQGLMAIGSGGFFGTGLGNSRQKYGFVSQPQNDFIFTIVCEELGFVGALLVIGLFAAFLWRCFHIARHAPDRFSALTVYGLGFKVALQVMLNIAVVTNSMPNTGIALPFFSYGGTSLILQIFEVGIILSISRYASHQKY